ncbi:MAG: hypothetical protein ACOCXI_13680 [Chloroflexota bacterium]
MKRGRFLVCTVLLAVAVLAEVLRARGQGALTYTISGAALLPFAAC